MAFTIFYLLAEVQRVYIAMLLVDALVGLLFFLHGSILLW